MHVIAIGSAFDGITLVGPFDTPYEAADWADENVARADWAIVDVTTKENYR